MRNVAKWGRITLGVFLIGYALNQFLHILPTSYGKMPELARDFLDAVLIFLPFLYVFEMCIGLLLIANKWTALVLLVIFPLSFSFLLFTLVNGDPLWMWPAVFVAGLNLFLLFENKERYLPLFD